MMIIELVAPAKLTLELEIVGLRPDGYHLIDAEMVSLDLNDSIHVAEGDSIVVEEAGSGLVVDSGPDNLVSRALRMVDRSAAVRIVKRIPAGAGLGGGSSDAAAVLAWAEMTDEVTAAGLGADVAFCLAGGRARVRGIGEIVEPLEFADREFTLLTPPFGVSTPIVYQMWDDLGGPAGDHGNDLEPAAVAAYPELERWRAGLGEATGLRPRLAGSGGTWFVEGHHDVEIDGIRAVKVTTVPARASARSPVRLTGREKQGRES